MRITLFVLLIIMLNGCTLPLMLGHLEFDDLDRTYTFNLSKERLKDRIVEQYSYDVGYLSKNFGKTLIENPNVNKKYRISTDEWLDKKNWDKYKTEIRQSIGDTTDIHIVKHHSRKTIQIGAIITGDNTRSALRIINLTADKRREFSKSREFYRDKFIKKIENKLIRRIN